MATRSPIRRVVVALIVVALGASAAVTATSTAFAVPGQPIITSPAGPDPVVVVPTFDNLIPDVTVDVALGSPGTGLGGVGRVQVREGAVVIDECTAALAVSATDFTCTVTDLPAGKYVIVAQHSEAVNPGASDWSVDSAPVNVVVGGDTRARFTGTLSGLNRWNSLAPTLTGEGPAYGSLTVEWQSDLGGGDVGSGTYCVIDEIPRSGEWNCVGDPFFEWGIGVTFTIVNALDAAGLSWPPSGEPVSIGGTLIPDQPSVTVTPGVSRIDVAGVGSERTRLSTLLYKPTVVPGEVYEFGPELDFCDGSDTLIPQLTCAFTDLQPGVWNVYTSQSGSETLDALELEGYVLDDYVLIPEPLGSFEGAVTAQRTVRFSGTGEPGFRALVQTDAGAEVCSALVDSAGAWQCVGDPGPGTASYRALQQSVGFVADPNSVAPNARSFDGFSAVSGPVTLTVPPAPASAPAPRPAATPAPISWTLEGYDGSPLRPGQTLQLSAQNLPPGTAVSVEIWSTPQLLSTAVANDLGTFSLSVTIPSDLEPGDHTLVATATPPGGIASAIELPATVVPVDDEEDEAAQLLAAPPVEPEPRADRGGAVDRSDPAAPSVITQSIPTLQRLFDDPWVVGASAGLALALLLLVAFPAELLNSTLSSNTGRLGRWFVALERRTEQVTEWFTLVSRTRALAAAILVAVTALIFGFVDPDYGFDPVSVRMTLSLAIGLFLITYVSAWISGSIVRRAWGVDTQVALQPVALLFAVVGVVVARLLEFSPGFLIGLVIGLDLLSRVDARVRARVVVLSTTVTASIAVAAWLAFSALSALFTGAPGWLELLISDALVATTAEGLTAALASLLPLGFLAGHEVFRHSKRLWAGTFVVVAALFALIVLPTAAGETASVRDIGFWMLIMVIFAVVTLTLWAVLQFTGRSSGDGDDADRPAESLGAESAGASSER